MFVIIKVFNDVVCLMFLWLLDMYFFKNKFNIFVEIVQKEYYLKLFLNIGTTYGLLVFDSFFTYLLYNLQFFLIINLYKKDEKWKNCLYIRGKILYLKKISLYCS